MRNLLREGRQFRKGFPENMHVRLVIVETWWKPVDCLFTLAEEF